MCAQNGLYYIGLIRMYSDLISVISSDGVLFNSGQRIRLEDQLLSTPAEYTLNTGHTTGKRVENIHVSMRTHIAYL